MSGSGSGRGKGRCGAGRGKRQSDNNIQVLADFDPIIPYVPELFTNPTSDPPTQEYSQPTQLQSQSHSQLVSYLNPTAFNNMGPDHYDDEIDGERLWGTGFQSSDWDIYLPPNQPAEFLYPPTLPLPPQATLYYTPNPLM